MTEGFIGSEFIVPHLAFVGYSGSGKTTLAAQVVARLKQKGYRIGALKHDAHDIQLDMEGKDTFRYTEAGADLVLIASPTKLASWETYEQPYLLEQLLQRFSGMADLILIEGYKNEATPKILVARTMEQLALQDRLTGLVAIATTLEHVNSPQMPILDLNDSEGIALFIENRFLF